MEALQSCLVCEHTEFTPLFNCKDFVASGEEFQLQRCNKCSFLFTNPRPDTQEIGRYYESDRYVSHAGDKAGFSFIYRIYDIVRDYSIRQKLKLIKRYHASGNLMDLGCGLGYFLNGVHLDGTYNAVGVDVSDDAVSYVKTRFNLEVKNETELGLFPEHQFDVITQWHVLEHVHLLNERMQQLKQLLKPGGTLFIAVPNSDSWDAKFYGPFWDGYDVPRHLYHFNQKSFSWLMKKHGFEVKETKAMLFDAPYISMRSEVHQKHRFPFLRGGLIGGLSTLKALGNKNYSSLLFIVKKSG